MFTQLNQYHVVMEVEPQYWQSPEGLKEIYLHSSSGGVVPLVAQLFREHQPSTDELHEIRQLIQQAEARLLKRPKR